MTDDDDVMIISQNGILIRQSIGSVSVIGRNTQGVRLINLDEGDHVIDVARIVKQDEDGEDGESRENGMTVSTNGQTEKSDDLPETVISSNGTHQLDSGENDGENLKSPE